MPNIELTNIIIDDFSKAKTSRDRIYTHILTHIHTGTSIAIQITSKVSTTAGTTDPSIAPEPPNNSSYSVTPV